MDRQIPAPCRPLLPAPPQHPPPLRTPPPRYRPLLRLARVAAGWMGACTITLAGARRPSGLGTAARLLARRPTAPDPAQGGRRDGGRRPRDAVRRVLLGAGQRTRPVLVTLLRFAAKP